MRTRLLSLCLLLSVCSYAQQKQTFKNHFGKKSQKQHARYKSQIEHLPQTTAFFLWDNDSWNITDTTFTYYNAKGLADSTLTTLLSGAQTQINYTYDEAGRETGYTMLQRDDKFFPWDSVVKSTSTYDQHGGLTSEVEYRFEQGSGWSIQWGSKTTYTYNTSNLTLTEETEYYDNTAQAYVKDSKGTYSYDSTGKADGFTSMAWDDVLNNYVNDTKIAEVVWYKWDGVSVESSLLASANVYEWNGSAYQLSSRMSSSYDSHDNEIESKEEILVGATWVIDFANKYLFTYTQDGAMIERIEQSWDNQDSLWNNNMRYAYSNFVQYNGLKDAAHEEIGLSIAPNPFSDRAEVTITAPLHNPMLNVYDLAGKKLQTLPMVSGKCVIEKGDLAPGVYFYTISDNQRTASSGKVIIK